MQPRTMFGIPRHDFCTAAYAYSALSLSTSLINSSTALPISFPDPTLRISKKRSNKLFRSIPLTAHYPYELVLNFLVVTEPSVAISVNLSSTTLPILNVTLPVQLVAETGGRG